jgi:hypothetical protein
LSDTESVITNEIDSYIRWIKIYSVTLKTLSSDISTNIFQEEQDISTLKHLPRISKDLTCWKLCCLLGSILSDVLSNECLMSIKQVQNLLSCYDSLYAEANRKKKANFGAKWVKDRKRALEENLPIPPQPDEMNTIAHNPAVLELKQCLKDLNEILVFSCSVYEQLARNVFKVEPSGRSSTLSNGSHSFYLPFELDEMKILMAPLGSTQQHSS